jgi:murein DD-endopeptidase MepM/ murein hydrolase activator NlpD
MADKSLSIIIVPHTKTSLRKFQITYRSLFYVLISLAMFVLVCFGTMVQYIKLTKEARNIQAIRRENVQLKATLQRSQLLTQKLNRRISFLNELSHKLKVIAGLPLNESLVRSEPMTIGLGGATSSTSYDSVPDPKRLLGLEKRAEYLEKSFSVLNRYFEDKSLQLSSTPSIVPSQGFVSSVFGMRRNPFTDAPDFHEGLDITNAIGTPVVSPADGVVAFTGTKGEYGNVVEIRHEAGISTLYGHLAKILVKRGQHLKRWQEIALVGNSGKSTGPHLHYEVHRNDQPVNPLSYILNLDSIGGP